MSKLEALQALNHYDFFTFFLLFIQKKYLKSSALHHYLFFIGKQTSWRKLILNSERTPDKMYS